MKAAAEQLGVGLHRDIPAADYHALPFCSNSRLSTLAASCPAKVRYEMDNPKEPTDAMILGTVVHQVVLEPDRLEGIAVAPTCDRRTKEGKVKWSNFCQWNAGKLIISEETYVQASHMAREVKANPHAAALLARATQREVSAIWEDDSGLMCKARFDALGDTFIVDLKTTADASPQAFARSVDSFGYHRQGAFYESGAAKNGIAIEDFVVIAVEKEPPYLVGIHRLTERALEAGTRELRPLIERYWLAESTGDWPSYQPTDLDLPAWSYKMIENQ